MRKYLNCVYCTGDLPTGRRKYCSDECIEASGRIPNHSHKEKSMRSIGPIYRPASAEWPDRRARIIADHGLRARRRGR